MPSAPVAGLSRLRNAVRRRLSAHETDARAIRYAGRYESWADAQANSTGYDTAVVLERTRDALLKIKRGEAAYERDSVVFDRPEYRFPVVTGLLRAAVASGGRLTVLDFGGSLGTSYFQCRRLLSTCSVTWCIVEQSGHVACGREHFEDPELRFYETIEECLAQHDPNVLLVSGVLQYLPAPYATLGQLLQPGVPHLIVDRTAFVGAAGDRLTIQTVPEWIYSASYPAWFFEEEKFARTIESAGYSLVAEFPGDDQASLADDQVYFKGFIYERPRSRGSASE
jgi:putative methyltransferase (TIGR04325 family)